MPKVIHLEKSEDSIAYGIETDTRYEFFTINRSNNIIRPINNYKKSDFKGYKHFAGVLGKFNPHIFILEKPYNIETIDFEILSTIPHTPLGSKHLLKKWEETSDDIPIHIIKKDGTRIIHHEDGTEETITKDDPRYDQF